MEAHVTAPTRARVGKPPGRMTLAGDERLARLAGSGDERAFATLYDRYHQQLYRYCRSMLRNDADAQDALQSTMAAAFGALRRDQRDAPLRPWLFRIAHNEAVSLLRRRRPEDELSAAAERSGTSIEDQIEQRQRLQLLLADLRELPDRQRGALVMRELSGLSHEDIAIALGASVGAAKQTIFEARRSLDEFAEGRAMGCEEVRHSISDADGRALRGRRIRAHLRGCSGCAAFADAISERRVQLRAIAPPLPAAAAAGLFARILGSSASHGGSGAGGSGAGGAGGVGAGGAGASGVGSGAGGFSGAAAGKTVGGLIATKTLAGVATVAVVATATVGATSVLSSQHRDTSPGRSDVSSPRGAAAPAAAGASVLGAPGAAGRAKGSAALGVHGSGAGAHGRSTTAAGHGANGGGGASAGAGSHAARSGAGGNGSGGNGATGNAGGVHSPNFTTPSGVSPPVAKGQGGSPGSASAGHANHTTGPANNPTGNGPSGSHTPGTPATPHTPSSSAGGGNSNGAAHCLAHSNGNHCPTS
jgi:RNA polymerase sigma factor (sigma-70 family)